MTLWGCCIPILSEGSIMFRLKIGGNSNCCFALIYIFVICDCLCIVVELCGFIVANSFNCLYSCYFFVQLIRIVYVVVFIKWQNLLCKQNGSVTSCFFWLFACSGSITFSYNPVSVVCSCWQSLKTGFQTWFENQLALANIRFFQTISVCLVYVYLVNCSWLIAMISLHCFWNLMRWNFDLQADFNIFRYEILFWCYQS